MSFNSTFNWADEVEEEEEHNLEASIPEIKFSRRNSNKNNETDKNNTLENIKNETINTLLNSPTIKEKTSDSSLSASRWANAPPEDLPPINPRPKSKTSIKSNGSRSSFKERLSDNKQKVNEKGYIDKEVPDLKQKPLQSPDKSPSPQTKVKNLNGNFNKTGLSSGFETNGQELSGDSIDELSTKFNATKISSDPSHDQNTPTRVLGWIDHPKSLDIFELASMFKPFKGNHGIKICFKNESALTLTFQTIELAEKALVAHLKSEGQGSLVFAQDLSQQSPIKSKSKESQNSTPSNTNRVKPPTDCGPARRMISHALGIRLNKPKQ